MRLWRLAAQVEEERLSRWHAAKLADYRKSVAAYRAFKEAYGKRQRKHEEVRDHVSKELNSQFNRCSPSSPEAQTDFIHSPRTPAATLQSSRLLLQIRLLWQRHEMEGQETIGSIVSSSNVVL